MVEKKSGSVGLESAEPYLTVMVEGGVFSEPDHRTTS